MIVFSDPRLSHTYLSKLLPDFWLLSVSLLFPPVSGSSSVSSITSSEPFSVPSSGLESSSGAYFFHFQSEKCKVDNFVDNVNQVNRYQMKKQEAIRDKFPDSCNYQ